MYVIGQSTIEGNRASDSGTQREADHRENLANTIRTLRAEDSQKTLEIVCLPIMSMKPWSGN